MTTWMQTILKVCMKSQWSPADSRETLAGATWWSAKLSLRGITFIICISDNNSDIFYSNRTNKRKVCAEETKFKTNSFLLPVGFFCHLVSFGNLSNWLIPSIIEIHQRPPPQCSLPNVKWDLFFPIDYKMVNKGIWNRTKQAGMCGGN